MICERPGKLRGIGAALVLILLAACQHQAPAGTSADDSRAQPEPATTGSSAAGKAPVVAGKHMVAAANPLAARAGLEILRAGGSAVDAAIATQMVLNVVEPQSSGIGGGAFLMHFSARSGGIDAFDGRETAPAATTPDMFQKPDGSRMGFHDAVPGGLSVGVPGVLRMLDLAHQKYGKLPWARLFERAIQLAEDGFAVSPRLNKLIAGDRHISKFVTTEGIFRPGGSALATGTTFVNKQLARTFRLIADGGADAFYQGEIARAIVNTVRNAPINPGRMTLADMAGYTAKRREPICAPYKVWLVCGMPPPTSGGVTTLQILGLLKDMGLDKLEPASPEAIHLIAEASRLAFADRNQYLADPDHVDVPTGRLIDPGYLAKRASLISAEKSMGKAAPGDPSGRLSLKYAPDHSSKGLSTSHLVVVDKDGNGVSMTTTIENAFGSRLMAEGFLLNNQLTDFSFTPVKNGKMVANMAWPQKRPRSSMSPTLVFDNSGKLVLAVGSPGGSRIIGYVTKTIIAALDWKMDIQAAIDLPHFVNRNGTTDLEQGSKLADLKPALEKLGHKVAIRPMTSGLHGILVTKEGLTGGADHRREGLPVGE